MKRAVDYLIVGSGSAGSVLANRLSANPRTSCLLLEAGGTDNYLPIHVPAGYLHTIGNKRTDWCFETRVQPGLGGRSIPYARGRSLGGCSSINGQIYMRGQKEDYDSWAALAQDERWTWDNLLPLFKRQQGHFKGASEFHGADGPWTVSELRVQWTALDEWIKAAEEVGIPAIDDFNTGDNFGASYFHCNQRKGWRLNAYQAFVSDIVEERQNLEVKTHTEVSKLLFDTAQGTKKCVGVRYVNSSTGEEGEIRVNKEVILAAGSIGDVQILERSGVGQGEHLTSLGIPVYHELNGVGSNLQDHLQIRPYFSVEGLPTLNTTISSLYGKATIGLEFLLNASGPLASAPSQVGCFAKSDPSVDRANLEFHIQPLSLDKFGEPLHSTFDAITASVCNLRPTSRGSVHITGRDVGDGVDIHPNYLATIEDEKVAVDSLKLARQIMLETETFNKYNCKEVVPGADVQGDSALLKAARRYSTTIFHPVGTCQMGVKSNPEAVVDSDLRVHGIKGLRIADASIMPLITSGNTANPTMVVAERAAESILLEDHLN